MVNFDISKFAHYVHKRDLDIIKDGISKIGKKDFAYQCEEDNGNTIMHNVFFLGDREIVSLFIEKMKAEGLSKEEITSLFEIQNSGGYNVIDKLLQFEDDVSVVLKRVVAFLDVIKKDTEMLDIFLSVKGDDGSIYDEVMSDEDMPPMEKEEILAKIQEALLPSRGPLFSYFPIVIRSKDFAKREEIFSKNFSKKAFAAQFKEFVLETSVEQSEKALLNSGSIATAQVAAQEAVKQAAKAEEKAVKAAKAEEKAVKAAKAAEKAAKAEEARKVAEAEAAERAAQEAAQEAAKEAAKEAEEAAANLAEAARAENAAAAAAADAPVEKISMVAQSDTRTVKHIIARTHNDNRKNHNFFKAVRGDRKDIVRVDVNRDIEGFLKEGNWDSIERFLSDLESKYKKYVKTDALRKYLLSTKTRVEDIDALLKKEISLSEPEKSLLPVLQFFSSSDLDEVGLRGHIYALVNEYNARKSKGSRSLSSKRFFQTFFKEIGLKDEGVQGLVRKALKPSIKYIWEKEAAEKSALAAAAENLVAGDSPDSVERESPDSETEEADGNAAAAADDGNAAAAADDGNAAAAAEPEADGDAAADTEGATEEDEAVAPFISDELYHAAETANMILHNKDHILWAMNELGYNVTLSNESEKAIDVMRMVSVAIISTHTSSAWPLVSSAVQIAGGVSGIAEYILGEDHVDANAGSYVVSNMALGSLASATMLCSSFKGLHQAACFAGVVCMDAVSSASKMAGHAYSLGSAALLASSIAKSPASLVFKVPQGLVVATKIAHEASNIRESWSDYIGNSDDVVKEVNSSGVCSSVVEGECWGAV